MKHRSCLGTALFFGGVVCFGTGFEDARSLVGNAVIADAVAEDNPRAAQKSYKEYIMESEEVLKKRLSKEQYYVVRENGTERPFANEFWNSKEQGIYVDVVSGEPLFSSTSKFDSGTGWPSFYEPISEENVIEVTDTSHGMRRVEVRSKRGDSHLGHIFNDGPKPTGLRYCINSAALRFIPVEKLEAEGYGQFLSLFKETSS